MSPEAYPLPYRGERGRQYHEQKRKVPEEALPWLWALRSQKFQNYVRTTDTVLEYGVGYGWNLANLRCRRRVGYDLTSYLEPFVQKLGVEYTQDISRLSNQSVDLVLCHHVLEHTSDPAGELRIMISKMNAQGRLLLYVPFETGGRYQKFRQADPNHHLFSWNCQSLGNLIFMLGLAVKEISILVYGYDRFAAAQACKYRLGYRGFRVLRALFQFLKPLREIRLYAEIPEAPLQSSDTRAAA